MMHIIGLLAIGGLLFAAPIIYEVCNHLWG